MFTACWEVMFWYHDRLGRASRQDAYTIEHVTKYVQHAVKVYDRTIFRWAEPKSELWKVCEISNIFDIMPIHCEKSIVTDKMAPVEHPHYINDCYIRGSCVTFFLDCAANLADLHTMLIAA